MKPAPAVVFLDLNQTLIRTGEVGLSTRVAEQRELEQVRLLCSELAAVAGGLRLVLLTGNSFEYARRVEEPLGLKHLPGVSVLVISENGLIARDFVGGDRWRGAVAAEYRAAADGFLDAAHADPELGSRFYSQGNEIRLTLKPVANRFTSGEIASAQRLLDRSGLTPLARVYAQPFYLDVDPREADFGGGLSTFRGKSFAVERVLAEQPDWRVCAAIGDSVSDLPMFEAVTAAGGTAYVVGNALVTEAMPAERVTGEYAAGVAEALSLLLEPLRR